MNAALDTLRQNPAFWGARAREAVPTGYDALDGLLPDGGWPVGALTEVYPTREGVGEHRLLLPCLARLTQEGRWAVWVSPPHRLYGPALAAAGIELARVLVVPAPTSNERWWAAEQALRSGACGAVLVWGDDAAPTGLRRLQLAAEKGRSLGFLFRLPRSADHPSPAALRLSVEPTPRGPSVRVLKGQGGHGRGTVLTEPGCATPSAALPRPEAAPGARRAP